MPVDDLATIWRLAMDIDTALDLVLLGGDWAAAAVRLYGFLALRRRGG